MSAAIVLLEDTLTRQRAAVRAAPVPDEAARRADLQALKRFVRENADALCEAISRDYGHRSPHETRLAEVLPVLQEIDHALKHLRGWMRVQRRDVDRLAFGLASNVVIPQPLGVVGVIVPWNFPLNLSLVPLVAIFAAGNRAMVKLSEHSRHLAALLIARIPDYFPPEKLQFFDETGDVGVAFSQPHALTLADLDGDGLPDIVTGKRRWAHGPKGDVEPMATPVNYAFILRRDRAAAGGARYLPRLIDDASGLGTQVVAADVNRDGVPDVLAASKLGAFVFITKRQ